MVENNRSGKSDLFTIPQMVAITKEVGLLRQAFYLIKMNTNQRTVKKPLWEKILEDGTEGGKTRVALKVTQYEDKMYTFAQLQGVGPRGHWDYKFQFCVDIFLDELESLFPPPKM